MVHPHTVLLVEDEPDDADLILRIFEEGRIANRVVVARDGQEALDWLLGTGRHAGPPLRPTFVLLDLKLPRLDGITLLRLIRANPQTSRLPVVLLTSSAEEEDNLRGYAAGANSYVRKPIAFPEFCEAVRALGLYWLALNEPPVSQ